MASAAQQKLLGAFYTDEVIARFLVRWAVHAKGDSVLDPSCGDGAFLVAAAERLHSLGDQKPQIWGIDVEPKALRAAQLRTPQARLLEKDFFCLNSDEIPLATAVVGNPPFIRYQTFNGDSRKNALSRAREAGAELTELSSSWAPFLIHSAGFLRQGGRLGMVAPAEIAHARYAREVLRFLFRRFGKITIRVFQNKLFPELSQDTVLLLCENYGKPCDWCSVVPAESIHKIEREATSAIRVDIREIESGKRRLSHYLLPSKIRSLYEEVSRQRGVARLGDAADVGIGYVTGANDFFHLSRAESKEWGIPHRFLKPSILSLGDCTGTSLRKTDWERLARSGDKVYLLSLPEFNGSNFPKGVSDYLAKGESGGVPERFKCRVRKAWYSVAHVRVGDAFLSYMSGRTPKLIANTCGLVAPNTLHVVRFKRGWVPPDFIAGWNSSFTRLSFELEGHPLGGGMLKLEPTEAENLHVPLPYAKDTSPLLRELDPLLRRGETTAATDLSDSRILRRRFGLSSSECATLRSAAIYLEAWRMHK